MCVDGQDRERRGDTERGGKREEADCLKLVDVMMQETHRPRRADPEGSGES